jgi:hypothetical protein
METYICRYETIMRERSKRPLIINRNPVKDVPDNKKLRYDDKHLNLIKFSDWAYDSANGNQNIIRSID